MSQTKIANQLRYLLLQVRNPEDPMIAQEISSFSRVIGCDPDRIQTCSLIQAPPMSTALDPYDLVLIGGSGHYSATSDEAWIEPVFDLLREIHRMAKPTFASCWGFQSMARAMGGQVVKDLERAELGTHKLFLTSVGKRDPLFSKLGDSFSGQMGHEDRVVELPPDAELLASSELVENQAYRFIDKPIYATQFHPELNCEDLLDRIQTYPEYIHRIYQMPPERFGELVWKTPETEALLGRFIELVFG